MNSEYDERYEQAAMRIILQPLVEEKLAQFDAYNAIPHTFTKKFETDMKRLFRRETLKRYLKDVAILANRIAVCLVITAVLMLAACATIEPLRERIANAFFKWSSVYVDVTFTENGDSAAPRIMTWLPDGYVLEDQKEEAALYLECYNNGENQIIFERRAYVEGATVSCDSEYSIFREIKINGLQGVFIERSDTGDKIITWVDGDYAYYISAVLPKSQLLKIAENVQ